jgi:phage terminase large subunit
MRGFVNFPAKPHQAAVLNDRTRNRCIVFHRRAGKTVLAVFACLEAVMTCTRPMPRVGFISPFLKQSKKLAWDYLANTVAQAPHVFDISKGELTVTFRPNAGKITLYGADNIDAIRGVYFDFVVVDEMADVDPALWDSVLVYCLADRSGRALISGTPRGRMNKLYEFALMGQDAAEPDWSYHCYTAEQTGMLPQGEIDRMKRQVEAGHLNRALYAQEMECSFNAALIGAIYGDEMNRLQAEGRYTSLSFDPSLPVMTAWDLGWADATAVWHIQRRGNQLHVIGYEEFSLTKLPDIIAALKAKPWAANYSEHFGPHDLNVTEYGSGNSRWQIADRLGFTFEVTPNWSKEDGIESVRSLLPMLWINTENGGGRALEVLVNYRFEFDADHRAFKVKPLHDWTSHGADALRMFAVAHDAARFGSGTSGNSRRRGRAGNQLEIQWLR